MLSLRPSTGCVYVAHESGLCVTGVSLFVYQTDFYIVSSQAMIYNLSMKDPVERV